MKGMTMYSIASFGGQPGGQDVILLCQPAYLLILYRQPQYPLILPDPPARRRAGNNGFVLKLFFFVFFVDFLRLLIKTFQLQGSLFIYLFDKLEDRLVLVFEEVLGLGQVATQQHSLFRVKYNGYEFDIRVGIHLDEIIRIEL